MRARTHRAHAVLCSAVAFLLLFVGPAGAESRIEGRVFVLEDGERRPAGGTWVRARVDLNTVATAPTAPDGSYLLEGVPAGQVEFDAVQAGFYTFDAAGVRARMAVKECPEKGSCGQADFVIVRGAILEGRITDPFGDPLTTVSVSLTRPGARRPPTVNGSIARYRDNTDDGGEFRLFGLAPGKYVLSFQSFIPLPVLFAEPLEIEIRRDETPAPVYVTMRPNDATSYSVSGTIQGLDMEPGEWAEVSAIPVEGNLLASRGISQVVGSAGGIDARLVAGEYIFQATVYGGRRRARSMLLGRRRIEGHVEDLSLQPVAPPRLGVQVEFEGEPPQRARLRLEAVGAETSWMIDAVPPRYRYFSDDLWPGRYRIEAAGPEWFLLNEPEFELTEGLSTELRVKMSKEFARISGVAKGKKAGRAFIVALIDSRGRSRAAQTDMRGGFSFSRVRPGDYRICAWSDLDIEPDEERSWAKAGEAVRTFSISPGDDTEIILTAAP